MKRWGIAQLLLTTGLSIALWLVAAIACTCVGSTGIHWPAPGQWSYRLEPVILSSLVGAALAAAGVVYQAILRNPLADPYLLGVSTGASLAGYLWKLQFIATLLGALGLGAAAVSQQLFAFAGALASVAIVLALSSRRGRLEPLTLLLVGVIVNAVNAAIFLLISTISRDLTAVPTFLIGGIQTNLSNQQIASAAVAIAIGWILLMWIAGHLNTAILSEGEAQSLGVRIHRLRWTAMVVASLITASAVAISGPIGFVGLVCPHLARLVVGSDHRRLLPISTALGAALLAIADAASRLMIGSAQTWLPVGVLTALLGGPFFLALLWQNRRRMALAEGLS
ncbi:MAG: iron ABC transporter permease [Phycisphaerales bacterium]|nr:iron ABC transporter permease [Phycisphaerales bacterium]